MDVAQVSHEIDRELLKEGDSGLRHGTAQPTKPPVDIILVKGKVYSTSSSSSFSSSEHCSIIQPEKTTIDQTTSALFRLKPRKPIQFRPFSSDRGKKRPAASMSSTGLSSITGLEVDTSQLAEDENSSFFSQSQGTPSPNDCGVDHAVANLRCLSLRSPDHGPSAEVTFENLSPPPKSQEQPSSVARSCFSRYSSSSLLQPHLPRVPSRLSSPAGSTRSSPRIAPLTVLGPSTAAADSFTGRGPTVPPLSIHCSIRSDASVNTSFSTIDVPDVEDIGDSASDRSFTIMSSSSPCRSLASMMERTPLPRISLTPRKQANRHDFPEFPSPTADEHLSLHFLPTSTSRRKSFQSEHCAGSGEVQLNSSGVDASDGQKPPLLFLPPSIRREGSVSSETGDVSPFFSDTAGSGTKASAKGGVSPSVRRCSRSLLKPSTSHNSMLAMLENSPRTQDPFDSESLCTSDDEDAFFLVPPSAVAPVEDGNSHRAKQRRVHSSGGEQGFPTLPSFTSRRESCGSLYGSALLASASANSLSAMDLEGELASNGPFRVPSSTSRVPTVESSSSDASPCDRDLITPPQMQPPSSPPPVAPQHSGEICAKCS